ncbi:hypothetical protein KsCSTR_19510 [Candidatus Kuenenia stuttgartiensis]|uniref:Uncharacterized protein n=1 Tax=Kuenenia stuttgartiensis TaxID=174633 RepID=Q1Q2J1_KUEST|nr:hypothetical protein KsCSTR_19510 [Candidatus Kuenenia stuttgartiensis]CAJ74233.1 unknown protein [Candidatus Kuenenia stuttgartiensis]
MNVSLLQNCIKNNDIASQQTAQTHHQVVISIKVST